MTISKVSVEDRLSIYYAAAPSEAVRNFVKIARCLGISAELVDLSLAASPGEELRARLASGERASVWDAASLGKMASVDWPSLAPFLAASDADMLLLVTGADGAQSGFVKVLSQGAVTGVHAIGCPVSVSFPANPPALSAQLSGQRYARAAQEAIALDVSDGASIHAVMELGEGSAAFVASPRRNAMTFIWSTFSVFDVDRLLVRELEFEQAADEYIPAIIFLRKAFGEQCWHNPRVDAEVIIDDPLLEKRYGFIDFPKLLGLAKELGIHITVAFIPWNHWRTRLRPLRQFLDHPQSFGICAHGCDHIKNEFRTRDYGDLLSRSHLAAERMDLHRERTGMEWDRLMVCPREDYTMDAMQALADSGRYLGLVNTGCIPRDADSKYLRGADLLLPVQDAFFGFPLFKRYYWSGISVFAMAAFLGKPAILVEHHDFFQDDFRTLKEFVRQLAAICPRVGWLGLTELASRTHARRRVTADTFEVRFFTDRFIMENPDPEPRLVRFRRRIPKSAIIESVTLNGTVVSCARDEEFVSFEAMLAGDASCSVHVQRRTHSSQAPRASGRVYGARVAARRFLSEFRDNWLARSKSVLRLANRLIHARA